jgi:xanthine dehydrogenase accessory factor
VFERIARLEGEHASFAVATVVARKSPVSSHLGDRALIFADGRMEGFVGGSCSRDIVRNEALEAIRSRRPFLLQIRPDASGAEAPVPADAERIIVPMSCASEGAVDVYIEPHVPLRRLVVVGFTPVADALVRLASALDYALVRVVSESELRDAGPQESGIRLIRIGAFRAHLDALSADACAALVAVVASQGHYDELALEALLAQPLAFVGLLASRRRAANVFAVLAQHGVPAERIASVHNPVGLDIGARSPGEVAVSVLAEIIARSPAPILADDGTNGVSGGVDPVCGMDVDPVNAMHRFEHAGTPYVFCSAGCRNAFAADPASFVTVFAGT